MSGPKNTGSWSHATALPHSLNAWNNRQRFRLETTLNALRLYQGKNVHKRQLLIAILLYLPACWVNAGLVTIDDKEWQSLLAFNAAGGVSWNELSGACSTATGACSGDLNGVNLDGWMWADANDVNGLFNEYFPGSAPGSGRTWTDMGPGPDSASIDASFWASRWSGSGFDRSHSHILTFPFFQPFFDIWIGWLRDTPGAQATVLNTFAPYPGVPPSRINTWSSWIPNERQYPSDPNGNETFALGAFLYRSVAEPVPVPGTAALLGLSLFLLRKLLTHTFKGATA